MNTKILHNSYYYKCFDCGAKYSSNEIEKNFIYICPKCGKAERNKPLVGVLTVEYDYSEIKKKITKRKFLEFSPGQFWQYSFLLPVNKYPSKNILSRLQLNSNPIIKGEVNGSEVYFFDDTRNPTLSYKDRASVIVALKALELGVQEISAASTGNAGSSLAGICARLGIKSHIFVPKNIPEAKRIQIQSYGANIYLVDGTYDDAFDLCLEISNEKKIYNRNTAYNPITIEGKKTSVFDMFIQMKGKLPEYIFVPVGDGVIISGIFKGLYDLKKLGWIAKYPKLVGVQAKGSNALVRFMKTNKFTFQTASTIADSISASAPRNLYLAAHAITQTNGTAITVSDKEILEAQKSVSTSTGILPEPSSAASLAGYKKLIKSFPVVGNSVCMIMLTGNGLKDTSALTSWNDKPKIYSASQLKKIFDVK